MSSSSAARAWIVAAGIAAVEALKDQGFCRWNYTLRSVHQHAKASVRSYSQAAKLSAPSSAAMNDAFRAQRARRLEESHGKVMQLSCFGPESIRF